MSSPLVSVVIVTYNCREEVGECLGAIQDDCEVIVVDNHSSDGTANHVQSEFPKVKLIQNDSNRGFGAANNQGLQVATGEFALILNPDAAAKPGAINLLASYMTQHLNVAACGGKLLFKDGTLQESACNELSLWVVFCEQTRLEKLFKHSSLLSPYWISRRHVSAGGNTPKRVAQVMGACVMLRRHQGEFPKFDERYNLYCEDTDLCKRISKQGEIWYVPEAEFVHALGSSSIQNRHVAVQLYNAGKERYFAIHHGRFSSLICFGLDRLGALGMAAAWSLATIVTLGGWGSARRKAALFWKVLFGPIFPSLPQSGS